jgi:Fe-S-cluster containining protein
MTVEVEKEVWKEVDCLTCANCCKTMSPTYTLKDIRRIASHTGMTADEFKKKWLYKERGTGDWLNKQLPCQFLNMDTNMCSIYDVRPADCAGFPHLPKKKMVEYMHVHKQNVEYCPATYKMVEKMMMKIAHGS